ncbi:MAG TPA: hypothetical protein VGK74_18305 [Symbiobacteriaceae bacterium]
MGWESIITALFLGSSVLVSALVLLTYGLTGRFWAGLVIYAAVILAGLFTHFAELVIVIIFTGPALLTVSLVLWLIDWNVRKAGTLRQARIIAVVVALLVLGVAYARM